MPTNYGDIPKPIKMLITNDLDFSFVKQGKLHRSGMALVVHLFVNSLLNLPLVTGHPGIMIVL